MGAVGNGGYREVQGVSGKEWSSPLEAASSSTGWGVSWSLNLRCRGRAPLSAPQPRLLVPWPLPLALCGYMPGLPPKWDHRFPFLVPSACAWIMDENSMSPGTSQPLWLGACVALKWWGQGQCTWFVWPQRQLDDCKSLKAISFTKFLTLVVNTFHTTKWSSL